MALQLHDAGPPRPPRVDWEAALRAVGVVMLIAGLAAFAFAGVELVVEERLRLPDAARAFDQRFLLGMLYAALVAILTGGLLALGARRRS